MVRVTIVDMKKQTTSKKEKDVEKLLKEVQKTGAHQFEIPKSGCWENQNNMHDWVITGSKSDFDNHLTNVKQWQTGQVF